MSVIQFPMPERCSKCGSKNVVGVVCLVHNGVEHTSSFCRDHADDFSPPSVVAFDKFAQYCVEKYGWFPAYDKASILFDIKAALAATGCGIFQSQQESASE